MAIRWNSQLKADLRRTVKSFNSKIRRLQQKGVTAALLPDMISSKEFYDSFRKHSTLTESEFKSIITTIRDVARIAIAHKSFDQRYKEFIDNPYAFNFYKIDINTETDLYKLNKDSFTAMIFSWIINLTVPQILVGWSPTK